MTMKNHFAVLLLALATVVTPAAHAAQATDDGFMQRISPYPVSTTLDRLETVLQAKGLKVFARIDHTAEAASVGLSLRPEQVLIFGNPRIGTLLMREAPDMGLDLPLRVLAWQDNQGQVHVVWNSPVFLMMRYRLDATAYKPLSAVEGLVDAALTP